MTFAEKSIIEPDLKKPGIPVKKSTLLVLGLILVVLGMGSGLFLQPGATQQSTDAQTASKGTVTNPETGTPGAIEEERAKADRENPKPVAAHAGLSNGNEVGAKSAAKDQPLPDGLKRPNNDAAFYEESLRKAGLGGGSQKSASGGRSTKTDVEASLDADVRQTKSVVFDDSPASAESTLANAGLKQLAALSMGGVPSIPQAPSAALQPALDNVMQLLKVGQQASAPASQASWMNDYASESAKKSSDVIRSYPTLSKYTLHQGKVIPAVLGRQVNSDLPGALTAFTTVDVYDSLGNGVLLIPKGSSLVGRYNSDIKIGQERVMFAFNRIILPDGSAFDLPAAQGSDLTGAAGAEGDVNNHFFKMFASSFLIAWSADRVNQPTAVTLQGGATTSPAGQVLVDVGRTVLERNRNIPPTITLAQGTRINVEVAKDMEFKGPYLRSKK